MLRHLPTGIMIKAQPTRLRQKNRDAARKMIRQKLDDLRAKGLWDPKTKKLIGVVEAGDMIVEEWEEDGPMNGGPVQVTDAAEEEVMSKDKGMATKSQEVALTGQPGAKKNKGKRKEEEKAFAQAYSREEIVGMKYQIKKANKIKNQKKRQRERDQEKLSAGQVVTPKTEDGV
jgi:hypothetical protein